jgi:hypothetical protein
MTNYILPMSSTSNNPNNDKRVASTSMPSGSKLSRGREEGFGDARHKTIRRLANRLVLLGRSA